MNALEECARRDAHNSIWDSEKQDAIPLIEDKGDAFLRTMTERGFDTIPMEKRGSFQVEMDEDTRAELQKALQYKPDQAITDGSHNGASPKTGVSTITGGSSIHSVTSANIARNYKYTMLESASKSQELSDEIKRLEELLQEMKKK